MCQVARFYYSSGHEKARISMQTTLSIHGAPDYPQEYHKYYRKFR
jgi:hypothetical protein